MSHSRKTSVVTVISGSCCWDLVGIFIFSNSFLVLSCGSFFPGALVYPFPCFPFSRLPLSSVFLLSTTSSLVFFYHLFYSVYFLGDRLNLNVILRSFKIMNCNHASSRSSLDAPPEVSEAGCYFVSLCGHPVFTIFAPNLRSELRKKLKGTFSQTSCCTLWESLFRDRLGCGFVLSLNLLQVFNLSDLLKRCQGFTRLYIQDLSNVTQDFSLWCCLLGSQACVFVKTSHLIWIWNLSLDSALGDAVAPANQRAGFSVAVV